MINDINNLARHRRFLRWLNGQKLSSFSEGGVGVHAKFTKNIGSAPSPHHDPAKTPAVAEATAPKPATPAEIAAITLSNALAIKALPPITYLPKSRSHGANRAFYKRLQPLWTAWLSNAHAICESTRVRGANIHVWAIMQYDLTEQIMAYYKAYEAHYN